MSNQLLSAIIVYILAILYLDFQKRQGSKVLKANTEKFTSVPYGIIPPAENLRKRFMFT